MIDKTYEKKEGIEVIYLAGGCFWGVERLMQVINGVVKTTTGYANGKEGAIATYQEVCSGKTDFRETVRVEYDPKIVSLETLLFAFFKVIDPTLINRQGHDVGTQYQSGIYFIDDKTKETVEYVASIEKLRSKKFYVEIKELVNFYEAEDYHQDYLIKNPNGYCHINLKEIQEAAQIKIDAGKYPRPDESVIKQRLSVEQYQVTQEKKTEAPFFNPYHALDDQGIYVDIVTGEPLFSSRDKYISSCGWPSFAKGIDPNAIVERDDRSLFAKRTEVLSRSGNTHLGHVFENDPESPSGIRYCINSASLQFIPKEEMAEKGYGYLLDQSVDNKEE